MNQIDVLRQRLSKVRQGIIVDEKKYKDFKEFKEVQDTTNWEGMSDQEQADADVIYRQLTDSKPPASHTSSNPFSFGIRSPNKKKIVQSGVAIDHQGLSIHGDSYKKQKGPSKKPIYDFRKGGGYPKDFQHTIHTISDADISSSDPHKATRGLRYNADTDSWTKNHNKKAKLKKRLARIYES